MPLKSVEHASLPVRRRAPAADETSRATNTSAPKRRLAHDLREHRVLHHLEAGRQVTQRTLSRDLGFALGLTNLIVRQLVTKGWVRVRKVSRRRILYLVTPAGVAAKARLTRTYVRETISFYRETRDTVQAQFGRLCNLADSSDRVPVVFYGAGEIAEIAYVCLQETPLELIGLVDPKARKPFFGTPVSRPDALSGQRIGERSFERLIVTAVEDEDEVRRQLFERGVPDACVWWL